MSTPVHHLRRAAKALNLAPINETWESGPDSRDCRRIEREAKAWLARHPEAYAEPGDIGQPRHTRGWHYATDAKASWKARPKGKRGDIRSLLKDIRFHAPAGAF